MIYARKASTANLGARGSNPSCARFPCSEPARHYLALSRLAAALEALISAGVNIVEAWDLAATASGSPALRRAVATWKPQLAAGRTPAELVRACPLFPEIVRQSLRQRRSQRQTR